MADVFVTWMRWALAGVVAIKTIQALAWNAPFLAALWLVALIAITLRARFGAGVIAAVAGVAIWIGFGSHHVVLIGFVALAFFLFDGERQTIALTAVVTSMYFYAGVNKLLFGFLSGDVIVRNSYWLPPVPIELLAALGTAAELWLAVAVVKRWRTAVPVAIALHVGIMATWTDFSQPSRWHVVFNGLAVALVVHLSWRGDPNPTVASGVGDDKPRSAVVAIPSRPGV